MKAGVVDFMLGYEDVVRDPIYGYVYLTKLEEKIINTPFFQRLRFIKQTPGASWVYPSANHTRFEHSLGVMHLAGELAEKLIYKDKCLEEKSKEEKEKLIQKVRLTGLLHDIGHGPFSHVFEEFLNSINAKITHENIAELMIKEKVGPVLKKYDFDDSDITQIINWLTDREYGIGSVVVESINVDVLDYLIRDTYHTGTTEYGWIDVKRIIDNMQLIRLSADEEEELRTNAVIRLREIPDRKNFDKIILAIDERAIIGVESFFLSRLQMFKAVYYHRTVRAIESSLVECMKKIADDTPSLKSFRDMSKKEELLQFLDKQKTHLDEFISLYDDFLIGKFLEKQCGEFNDIVSRRQRRTAYEKTIITSADEFGLYARRLRRRSELQNRINEELRKEKINANVILDVPFPLLPIKFGKVYIKYDEEGVNKIATIRHYGLSTERETAPILKRMIRQDAIWMIDQRVLANTTNYKILGKIRNIARRVMGVEGVSPHF